MRNNIWKTKKLGRGKIAVALTLLAALLAGCGNSSKANVKNQSGSPQGSTAIEALEETTGELSVTDLLKEVMALKDELKTAMEDVKTGDIATAKSKMDGASQKTNTIRSSLIVTMESLGDSIPSMQVQLKNIYDLLGLADVTLKTVMQPSLDYFQNHPFSKIRSGDGVNTKLICDYLDFAESLVPNIQSLVEQANAVDLSIVDSEGKITRYLETANDLLAVYQKDNSVFDELKTVFGANGDRLYVIAAQNSAEIRASGGFPGAVGTIRIQDGVLTLGDFKKVYNVFSSHTPTQANITSTESRLFHGGLSAPRDADYCPDFERVAYIWALGYEAKQSEHVDGVISATPAIVQKLLAATEEEIKLFDGTVLTGDDATKILQRDLYFQYFGRDYVNSRDVIADQLFADAAKKTAQKLTENLEVSDLMQYMTIAKESFADRTLMLWMEDETEQAMIRKLGWHGGLNTDPEKPQAGIYYNCTVASKMGWFLVMDTKVGERIQNEDGSYTYPITVTFSNDMTAEELREASSYITGGNNGSIGGSAYFFAPAGGSVSDFNADNGANIEVTFYNDLQLGYMRIFNIYPDRPVTVTYNVTTAPGVETPLALSKTPTVQEYHK